MRFYAAIRLRVTPRGWSPAKAKGRPAYRRWRRPFFASCLGGLVHRKNDVGGVICQFGAGFVRNAAFNRLYHIGNAGAAARVRQITDFIAEYNGIGISVRNIAKRFSLTERRLNRIFNTACGNSPKQVINHQKLKKLRSSSPPLRCPSAKFPSCAAFRTSTQ